MKFKRFSRFRGVLMAIMAMFVVSMGLDISTAVAEGKPAEAEDVSPMIPSMHHHILWGDRWYTPCPKDWTIFAVSCKGPIVAVGTGVFGVGHAKGNSPVAGNTFMAVFTDGTSSRLFLRGNAGAAWLQEDTADAEGQWSPFLTGGVAYRIWYDDRFPRVLYFGPTIQGGTIGGGGVVEAGVVLSMAALDWELGYFRFFKVEVQEERRLSAGVVGFTLDLKTLRF